MGNVLPKSHRSKLPEIGDLSIGEAERGTKLCVDNAERHLKAGRILFKAGFVDQATLLTCAAIEETGKAFLLIDYQEDSFKGEHSAVKKLETTR